MAFARTAALTFALLAVSMIGPANAQAAKFHKCRIQHIVAVPIPERPTPGFIPHVGVRCINSVTVGTDTLTDFVVPTDAQVFKLLVAANKEEVKRDVTIQYFTDGATADGMCNRSFCRKFRSIIML